MRIFLKYDMLICAYYNKNMLIFFENMRVYARIYLEIYSQNLKYLQLYISKF